jgi:hypothetical protein
MNPQKQNLANTTLTLQEKLSDNQDIRGMYNPVKVGQ